jgi:segregation and condensation protein B
MSDEINSLADQAAAWVPPWARQPSPAESDPSPAADSASEDPPVEDDAVESRADAEPSLDAAVVEVQVDAASPDAGPVEVDSSLEAGPDDVDQLFEAEPGLAAPASDEPAVESLVDTGSDVDAPIGGEPPIQPTAKAPTEVDPTPDALVDDRWPTEAEWAVEASAGDESATGLSIGDEPAGEASGPPAEPDESDMSGDTSAVAGIAVVGISDPVDGLLAGDWTFDDGSAAGESISAEATDDYSLVGERAEAAPESESAGVQTALPIEDEPKVELSDDELRGAVEAILLIVDEPATEIILAQVLDQPVDRIAAVLERCAREYAEMGRGFELRRVAGGWRLYTRAEYAAYVEKFVLDGQQVRLTQAALETLAVVAYKQPVTRSRISAIRGVNCDGVVRTLVARGLIEECGSEPESGAFLYRTTILFLEKLGLDSVEQLPPLAPFLPDDVDEIADAQR